MDARIVWTRPPSALVGDFEDWGKKVVNNAYQAAIDLAQEWETYAKAFAPWQDQTGEARDRLDAFATRENVIISVILRHGVFYGFYLETMQGGRFAIISPSVSLFGRKLMEKMEGIGLR